MSFTCDCDELARNVERLIGQTMGREDLPGCAALAHSLCERVENRAPTQVSELLSSLALRVSEGFSHIYEGRADPAQALPLLASCIETLGRASCEAASGDGHAEETALRASIYQIQTLFPHSNSESSVRGMSGDGPDVPRSRLARRRKKNT